MPTVRAVLAALSLLPPLAHAQPPAAPPVFAVAYIEARADAAAQARLVVERYRNAARRQAGCVAAEVFEQIGRPGHFAVLEQWRDQAAVDARDPAPKRELLDALQPLRVSDYDERPYKPLAVAEAAVGRQPGVFVIAHVDVAPNTQAPELLARLATASRGEPGNLRFDVLQHAQRGNHFTVVEHWRSEAALDEHVAAGHTRAYRDALQPLTGSPLDERVYTAIGARP